MSFARCAALTPCQQPGNDADDAGYLSVPLQCLWASILGECLALLDLAMGEVSTLLERQPYRLAEAPVSSKFLDAS
jgi:hypothetical protein